MSVNPLQPKIQGLTYPLTISNGSLSLSQDLTLVSEHIISVLETRWFERVMRASYGTDDIIFEVIRPEVINTMFQNAIVENVPEISACTVSGNWISSDNGKYDILITYYVNGVPQPPLNFVLSI